MPQGSGNQGKKKKKGHKPAHQNSFAFHHNPKSKLTDKILSSPNEGVCRRCYDKIEWRKKYRKYKPLTQPAKCNVCHQRNITRAYHTICQDCSRSEEVYARLDEANQQQEESNENKRPRVCAVCVKEPVMIHSDNKDSSTSTPKDDVEQLEEELVSGTKMLKLRERKALERKVEKLRREEKERKRIERKLAAGIIDKEGDDSEEENDSIYTEEENDETQDDLLEAVGGKDKLLIGEAYQQMLLQKENSQTT